MPAAVIAGAGAGAGRATVEEFAHGTAAALTRRRGWPPSGCIPERLR